MNSEKRINKSVFSWALYDWANSAFATTVIAGFFPIFFKQYWSAGADVSTSTFKLGLGNSLGGLFLALIAPLLGAIADSGHSKKRFLAVFMFLGSLSTIGFYFVGQGNWMLAVGFYVLASLGFAGGNIFYDALITIVTPKKNFDVVSGFGFALGYLGGGILFVVNVLMYLKPELFGLADGVSAIKWSFVSVGIWWMLFSLPLFKNVHEKDGALVSDKVVKNAFRNLIKTFKKIKAIKPLFLFLGAYFFYIDAVNTMIKMAVDYGMSLGFEPTNFITALIIVQFVAFPCAYGFGVLGSRIGAIKGIYITLMIYIGITIFGYFMTDVIHFYWLAGSIGVVQGGVQALSRSHFASMIPHDQSGEFFGFFNMFGKFSAVLGPVLVGWVSMSTGSPRLSILVILLFLVLGGILLTIHQKSLVSDT